MASQSKYTTDQLRAAIQQAFESGGEQPLRADGFGRAQVFRRSNGETVRYRTTRTRCLVCSSPSPDMEGPLDIEGTDWLAIAMPAARDQAVEIFLVPAGKAAEAVKSCHKTWMETIGSTKGENTTPAIWFGSDGPSTSNQFSEKWAEHLMAVVP